MHYKESRHRKSEVYGRQRKQAGSYRHKIGKFLQAHKNSLFTSLMLLLLVVLLFGIFSQLQPPSIDSTPAEETTIGYSTFVKLVKAGNVQAITIRGSEINGLLTYPLAQNHISAPSLATPAVKSPTQTSSADYTAWKRYIGIAPVTPGITNILPIDADRAIYTHVPGNGDAMLMSLLISHHVIVTTLPLSQSIDWFSLFWKFLAIIFMVVLLFLFLGSRNNMRASNPTDHLTRTRKSRVQRFTREKETAQPEARKPTTVARVEPTHKPTTVRINTEPHVTFADVAGINEVRSELEEIVQFLRQPERFGRLGARIPRGALLIGPPGTGKTLLARAVAGEADVPFFHISASEFVEMFVGVGASRVRDLFNQARQAAPCVVFIDEIDAAGRKRSVRMNGNDERDQTLNQLLVELDGFDPRKAIVVLAATNRVDILDKALLRPGRFDRRITVSLPDRIGREAILRVHTRLTPLGEDVDLQRLARLTTGMSGADLANLVNEAALSAARLDLECLNDECFEQALARIQLGALRPLVMSEQERRIIAYHEGGHALVAYHLPEADTVNRVTILPRGQSLGVTQFSAEEDRYNYSRETLMVRIAVGLGGRVAEELTFGSDRITTGAENDLQVVTDLARRMVTRWGMSEQVGVVFSDYHAEGDYSLNMQCINPANMPSQSRSLVIDANGRFMWDGNPSTLHFALATPAPQNVNSVAMNTLIDAEVRRILNEGREMARRLLVAHADQLAVLANTLMEHEQLDRAQFEKVLQGE